MKKGKKNTKDIKKGILKEFYLNHKKLFIILLFLIFIILVFFSFKLFNYAKFVLGFDLTIRLGVDKNDIFLHNNESSEIEFNIETISSIFCISKCEYKFIDLDDNLILTNKQFIPTKTLQKNIKEQIIAPEFGTGQKLYAFDLVCHNQKSLFCSTEEKNVSRRIIITVEYNLSEQQQSIKNDIESKLLFSLNLTDVMNQTINLVFNSSNNKFLFNSSEILILNRCLNDLEIARDEFLPVWISQNYKSVDIRGLEIVNSRCSKAYSDFNFGLSKKLVLYNEMIRNITFMNKTLVQAKFMNLNETQSELLNKLIINFNNKIFLFSESGDLSEKLKIINSINLTDISFFVNQAIDFGYNYTQITIQNLSETNFVLNITPKINSTLPETKNSCCLYNICSTCKNQEKPPILLLHGHNFNQDISADNIINNFDSIQNGLESIGYFNAGELYLYEPVRSNSGLLAMINRPVVVRASYYFDFLKKPEGYKSIQIKSENIDTYALRLKEIIENLKYETNSSRIIVITHSMGGLVLRRYVQIFGNESLEKAILISSPNSGVSGTITKSCAIFGAISECEDMDSDSLFLNKLNLEPEKTLPQTYNIVGSGCKMASNLDGDGIVLINSALLNENENIKNIIIKGSCSGITFFHNSILNIDKYPEVFEAIKMAINN